MIVKVTDATERQPRGRRPLQTVDEVLDAAERLLARDGFEGMSVRRLADDLGVSRQVVYTYFGGMNGLFDALHRRLSARLTMAVRAVGSAPGTDDHMLEAAAAYRATARRWPELYQLVFERPVPDYIAGSEAATAAIHSFVPIIDMAESWLRTARPDAAASRRDAIDLARAMWSTLHGFVVLERVGFATSEDTDRLSDRAITSLLAGWM